MVNNDISRKILPDPQSWSRVYKALEEENMDEKICYCFNYSAADLAKDVLEHGRSTIMERIMAESKKGNCSCEHNNPKGR